MKLVSLVVVMLLGTGIAHADAPQQRGQFRQLLLQRFDRNHDGRLDGRERKQAARALRRIAKRLAQGDQRQQRHARFIQRYDRNGDGNVGPREMPPGLADEMRPLDRDGDGWIEADELP